MCFNHSSRTCFIVFVILVTITIFLIYLKTIATFSHLSNSIKPLQKKTSLNNSHAPMRKMTYSNSSNFNQIEISYNAFMKYREKALSYNVSERDYLQLRNKCSLIIPCIIWIMWDKGFDRAPPSQKMCLNSFRRNNPDFTIRTLNLQEAEQLIDRSQFYPDIIWKRTLIQAKSDVIRLEIIARYGGIWVDASLYCMEPLSRWIDDAVRPTHFFVYGRKDTYVNKDNAPWIASWLIASTNTSRMIHIWRDTVRKAWQGKNTPPTTYGYFWNHRIFRNLALNHLEFKSYFKNMTFEDAGGPHCWPKTLPVEQQSIVPHVYKWKAEGCGKIAKELKIFEQDLTTFNLHV